MLNLSIFSSNNRLAPIITLLLCVFSLSATATSFSLQIFKNVKKQVVLQTEKKLKEKGVILDLNNCLAQEKGKFPTSKNEFQQFIKDKQKDKLFLGSLMTSDKCAEIEFIDLRGVPGYPQIDDVTTCGAADTLSMIIFTGDFGEVNGFEFEIDLPEGVEYGGFEYAQLGGTSISISDPTPSRRNAIF